MKLGQWRRGSSEPAPVGRPDYYKRELHPTLLVRGASSLPVRSFLPEDHTEPQVIDIARKCRDSLGVYPLNFSFPRPQRRPEILADRPHFLSSTIPGEPFSFSDWDAYLEEYQSAYFALSTKKGGWDTFRHLEILFSGAVPLMPGLAKAHPFALSHYPKRALVSVYEDLVDNGPAVPDQPTREFFIRYANEHLTSAAMAQYFLDATGIDPTRALFIDRSLATKADYLSAFSFIGLKQVLGNHMEAAFEPAYLFDDYPDDTARFYGKGFGYSLSLPASLRSQESLPLDAPIAEVVERSEDCDTIVIGNYDGNRELAAGLLEAGIPPPRIICILGSDLPPDGRLLREIRASGMTFFVREFGSF